MPMEPRTLPEPKVSDTEYEFQSFRISLVLHRKFFVLRVCFYTPIRHSSNERTKTFQISDLLLTECFDLKKDKKSPLAKLGG